MPKVGIALCLALALFACSDDEPDTSVVVNGETLIGQEVESGRVHAFLGVPFAEPPVGELRWQAPRPLTTKLAHREVTSFAPACMQSMRILDWYRWMAVSFGGEADYYDDLEVSEDCLYLNVWTPTLDDTANLPVMVWIHGGSNRSGWSYEPNYHGHKLAQKGVVVVSVAYRQGLFGFISHDELPTDQAQANFGLWDLIASLGWIQNHIGAFGGDRNRVMLFGESAGGQNILSLMMIEQARDLFHGASLQSTGSFGIEPVPTLEDERERMRDFAERLGDRTMSLEALRELPADELLAVYEEQFSDYYHQAAIDTQLIHEPHWQRMQKGLFPDIPLIIGTNADETSDADQTNATFLCPSQGVARFAAAANQDVWMYYLTRAREGKFGQEIGAYHGAEYPYQFGTHDDYMPTTEIDVELQKTMQAYWLTFAYFGIPKSTQTPLWPAFDAPDYFVQELGDTVKTIEPPEQETCEAFLKNPHH
ncbi:MAG: carboxylesterase family protein [Pseudomonadota bacterium]